MTGQVQPPGLHRYWLASWDRMAETRDGIAASAGIQCGGRKYVSAANMAAAQQPCPALREEAAHGDPTSPTSQTRTRDCWGANVPGQTYRSD